MSIDLEEWLEFEGWSLEEAACIFSNVPMNLHTLIQLQKYVIAVDVESRKQKTELYTLLKEKNKVLTALTHTDFSKVKWKDEEGFKVRLEPLLKAAIGKNLIRDTHLANLVCKKYNITKEE